MHRKSLAAVAVAGAALACAAPASAVTIPLTYDHVVLDTPVTPYTEVVSPSTAPLTVTADVDPATGAFTVQPADWNFLEYDLTNPVPAKIDIELAAPATGSVDFATGALTFNGNFNTKISLGGEECLKNTGPLVLTTETTRPIQGFKFPAGATGPVTGAGAFGAGWDTLAPGTGPACALVDSVTNGEGGLWISRGIDPKPYIVPDTPAGEAKLALAAKKPAKVKAGRRATVNATVRNTGDADAAGVKVCLAAPKPLKPRRACKTVGVLAAGTAKAVSFKVKTKKGKPGKYALALRATGTGLDSVSKKLTLKVTK